MRPVGTITSHFTWEEFACHDEARTPVPEEFRGNAYVLACELERIRLACGGKPLTVTRGYSTPAHNATIPGAAKASYHLRCLAADILPPEGIALDELVRRIRRIVSMFAACKIRYLKIYDDGHLHVDCRPTEALVVEDARTT